MKRTHVRKHLFCKSAPFSLIKAFIEAHDASAALKTITCHLKLIHSVDVLNMHLDAWAVWSFGCPEVEIFMAASLKV